MKPVLTPAEMAAADERAIAAGTPVEMLMERAGRAVAWAVRRVAGAAYGRRVAIVCGKGNNGGDGLVAARVLRGWGMRADVLALAQLGDGAEARAAVARAVGRADVVVDAMYGTGFRGALEGAARDVVAVLDADTARPPVVAVDIPSGVDGLTGAVAGAAVRAHVTVAFAALKPGLLFEPGRTRAGAVDLVDIGIDVAAARVAVTERGDVVAPAQRRARTAHKWQSGVMVVGGSAGMTGAPMMASRAALRAGAGIVWCYMAHAAAGASAGAAGGEVITRAVPATPDGGLDGAAVPELLHSAGRFGALVVGPGLGRSEATAAAVRRLVAEATVPLVLDADGLNALDGDLAPLTRRAAPTVLTPHAGEYERVAGGPVGDDRLAAARRLAERAGSVVLLKGPATVIAAPDGTARINPTGGEWLATGGTGDVLSGLVGAFLAGGGASDPLSAAAGAAWVHGRAADHAGHAGLVAGDLIDAVPPTLREIQVRTSAPGGGR